MERAKITRLAVMMAGVYAVQGAWWPLLAVHLNDLGVPGRARGWIFATLAMSSLVTPLAIGQLVDRYVPAPRVLTCIYLLGSCILAFVASGAEVSAIPLFLVFLVYWLITAPAASLANTIAFRNLERPASQFGGVRLWGTVGWMVSGWMVSLVMAVRGSTDTGEAAYEAFVVASAMSVIFALYCLTLPKTAPALTSRSARDALQTRKVWDLCRSPSIFVLLVVAFGVSLTTPFVYQVVPAYLPTLGLSRTWIASAMTLGQIPEIATLAVLPRILGTFGFRGTMALGIAAWMVYHGILAVQPPLALALVALPIQGLSIALFHISASMYLDTQAPGDRRASVQGLYLLATTGLGNLLGSLMAGEMVARVGQVSAPVFRAPLLVNTLMLLVFLVGFFPHRSRPRHRGV